MKLFGRRPSKDKPRKEERRKDPVERIRRERQIEEERRKREQPRPPDVRPLF
jgi:hypothetical protein